MFVTLKLAAVCAALWLGAAAPAVIQIADPEQERVVRTIPATDSILREANALLRHLQVYGGLRVPEGWVIRIPLPGERRIDFHARTIVFSEMTLIRSRTSNRTVILIVDSGNRPYLFTADPARMERLLQLLKM